MGLRLLLIKLRNKPNHRSILDDSFLLSENFFHSYQLIVFTMKFKIID